jgi:hypothetical protein
MIHSVGDRHIGHKNHPKQNSEQMTDEKPERKHTLDPYMDIILRLFGLAGVFVSFGEGVCYTRHMSASLAPKSQSIDLIIHQKIYPATMSCRPGAPKPKQTSGPIDGNFLVYTHMTHKGESLCGGTIVGVCWQRPAGGVAGRGGGCEEKRVAKPRLTEGLEVFDGHKLGLLW